MPLLGGVRPPVAALLSTLLLVATLTALVLVPTTAQVVAPSVATSQQRIAEDYASAVRGFVDEDVAALRRQAALLSQADPGDEAAALKLLGTLGPGWKGAAVADPRTDKLLAVTGETVPANAVSGVKSGAVIRPTVVVGAGGQARLVLFAALDIAHTQRLLVATDDFSLPSPERDPGRSLLLLDRTGRVLGTAGVAVQDRKVPSAAAAQASRAAGGNPTRPASGVLLGSVHSGARTVAGWSSVATGAQSQSAAGLGLTVVTSIGAAETRSVTGDALFALVASAGLLTAALLVTLLLVVGLQRPLLRLHVSGARIARGDLSLPVRSYRTAEPARIAHALEALRQQLLGAADPGSFRPLRRRFGAGALVVCCGLLLFAWSAPLLMLGYRPDGAVVLPQQLVTDQELRTAEAADMLRTDLADGYTALSGVAAALTSAGTAGDAHRLLRALPDQQKRFRSVYVLAKDGAVLARTGAKPEQALTSPRTGGGVLQLNTSGRVPVVAVYAAVPPPAPASGRPAAQPGDSAPASVVAEIDVKTLSAALDRPGLGSVWLLDGQRKVIAANSGYRAFQDLPDPALTRLTQTAEHAAGIVVQTSDGGSMAAAAPLGGSGGTFSLPRWRVVSSQDGSRLDLDVYRTRRLILLAGLLGLAAATGCLGWLYVVVVRPLGRLAPVAERLAGGDRRTVLYPVNHDEVGSVTRSLELLRQQLSSRVHSHSSRV